MKLYTLIFFVIYLIISNINTFGQSNALELRVKITNIQHNKGEILTAIYSSREDFLNTPLQYKIEAIGAGENSMQVVFSNLKQGEYAVSVFHDENESGKLEKNILGIPKEPFGFSNNARAKFSPPSFEDCMVRLNGGESSKTIQIEVKDW